MACKFFLLALCVFGVYGSSQSNDYQQDVRYVKIKVDGQEYPLVLKSRMRQLIFDNTPVWTVKSNGDQGFTYEKVEDEQHRLNGIFYENTKYMATLLATYDAEEQQIYYNGVLGFGTELHVVKSAPENWYGELPDNDAQSTEDREESKTRSAYVPGNNKDGDLSLPLSVLHPKILVVVDNKLYKKFNGNIPKIYEYINIFYNALDLEYSKLDSPKIETLITGIIIETDEQSDLVEKARDHFSEQFVKDTGLTDYDASFVMTTSISETPKDKIHLGSICNRSYSTVYVQDDANYNGLYAAIHNLGHLLNLPHDGQGEAESCKLDSENEVTIMAPEVQSAKAFKWSQCSKNILHEFAKSKAAKCLEVTYRYE